MKKYGFSLAEVLLAFMVIGIVAMVTYPMLIYGYQKSSCETGLKKAYNSVYKGVALYMSEKEDADLLTSPIMSDREALRSMVYNNFTVETECGSGNKGVYNSSTYKKCFAEKYTALDSSKMTSYANKQTDAIVFRLRDKSVMTVIANNTDSDIALEFEVDVNGPKGPNIFGKDFFYMHVAPDGSVFDKNWDTKYVTNIKQWETDAKSKPVGIGRFLADGWKFSYWK